MSRVNSKYSRGKSKIEWTEKTWNPVTGCSKVTKDCDNCYAEKVALWLQQEYKKGNHNLKAYANGFKVTCHPQKLDAPKYWQPKLIFVNSMSDLFHPEVPLDYIQRVFEVMNGCPRHIFQILTKRPGQVRRIADQLKWTENIWMGTSVGHNDARVFIDRLRDVPAKIRFVSFEPLIERIDEVNLEGMDWALIGGESPGLGFNMRPCKLDWITRLVDICDEQHVAVFVKQLGGVLGKQLGMINEKGKTDWKGGQLSKFPAPLQRREYPIDLEAHFEQFQNMRPMIGGTAY